MLVMCEEDHEIDELIDSACSLHIIWSLEYLHDFKAVAHGGHVNFRNDEDGIIWWYGVLKNGNFSIQWVAYVEGLKHNLISFGQLCKS